jgi:hypothetical protein
MKLTESQVKEIKVDLTLGTLTQAEIAKENHVSRSIISDIATERRHKKVPWPNGKPCPKKPGGQRNSIDYNPTDERVMELESDIIHLTEERNREKAKVKAGAKVAGLFRAIVKEMEVRVKPYTRLPGIYILPSKAQIVEDCVMHLSDGHSDMVVKPEAVGGLEEYDFQISCVRAERYVDTVIDWTQKTLSPAFLFPTLWVLAYGDHTSGEIHRACERSYYRNQFKNCLAIGQLHALMYRDLAPFFKQINVLYLAGNHGRRSVKKDYNGAQENWDYLVAEVAHLHCKNLDNVSFLIPDAYSANVLINGVGFSVSHGDDVKGNLGIPWYGAVRRQKGLTALGAMTGQRPRYFVMGHHHTASTLSDLDGEMLVNGSWVGTDPFAYNALAGYREPCQLFHGVNPKYGVSWRLHVKLKAENEKKTPTRYVIDGGRGIGPLEV